MQHQIEEREKHAKTQAALDPEWQHLAHIKKDKQTDLIIEKKIKIAGNKEIPIVK